MAQPLTDAINALTRYANETTGQSDQTLSDAVETLVEGYGQGGGGDDLGAKMVDGSITEYINPDITKIRPGAFSNCYDFETLICHNVSNISGNFLDDNRSDALISPLVSLALPLVPKLGGYVFQNSKKLGKLDLTACWELGQRCFEGCWHLTVLVLRRSTLVSLYSTNAFNATPFVGRSGRTADLYVPADLLTDYQSNSNWSTILTNGYTTIHTIEGSAYENSYVDGTPIE